MTTRESSPVSAIVEPWLGVVETLGRPASASAEASRPTAAPSVEASADPPGVVPPPSALVSLLLLLQPVNATMARESPNVVNDRVRINPSESDRSRLFSWRRGGAARPGPHLAPCERAAADGQRQSSPPRSDCTE